MSISRAVFERCLQPSGKPTSRSIRRSSATRSGDSSDLFQRVRPLLRKRVEFVRACQQSAPELCKRVAVWGKIHEPRLAKFAEAGLEDGRRGVVAGGAECARGERAVTELPD